MSVITPGSSVETCSTNPPEQVQSVPMEGKMQGHEDQHRLVPGGSLVSLFSAQ